MSVREVFCGGDMQNFFGLRYEDFYLRRRSVIYEECVGPV